MIKATILLTIFACALVPLNANPLHKNAFEPEQGGAKMNTNIALLGSRDALGELIGDKQHNLAIVDPSSMLDGVAKEAAANDIQEDPNDRFITSRSGKRRPILLAREDEWAKEEPVAKLRKLSHQPAKSLSRKRRCGNNDDDGNARRNARRVRARRTRRNRRARAKAAKRAQASTSTTTVTRKVIQNGQVISQTTEQQQPLGQVIVQQQPAVQPVVRTVQTPVAQPVVVAQPAVAQPVVQQPVAQQPAAAVAGVPSIAVNGSVKIN